MACGVFVGQRDDLIRARTQNIFIPEPAKVNCLLRGAGYFGSSVCGEVPSAIQQLSAGAYTPSSEAGSDEQYISSVSIPASVRAEFIRFIRLDLPVPDSPLLYMYTRPNESDKARRKMSETPRASCTRENS